MTLRATTSAAALLAALAALPLAAQESTAPADAPMADQATTAEPAEVAPADPTTPEEPVATDADAVAPADGAATGDAMAAEDPAATDAGAPGEVAEGAAPNADMQAVLDKLVELGSDPIGTLPPEAQRQEPTPADAVAAVMAERGIPMPPELEAVVTRDVTYPGGDGSEQAARIYTPPGEGPFPLIVYYHGGGWVIADIDTYDASARALAAGAEAVVMSVEYRKGPENPFPAAHEDADAAYVWAVENSGSLNADSERLAVAGESAGGNLAINVALNARDLGLTQPDHMVLVYPLINDDLTLPSYVAYAEQPPLTRVAVDWFVANAFADPAEVADPRIDVLARNDLAGLPPATIVNAELDVLQSEGELLAEALGAQGVAVEQMTYPGVVHEFFGMGAVVPEAKQAMDMATAALRGAFAQ